MVGFADTGMELANPGPKALPQLRIDRIGVVYGDLKAKRGQWAAVSGGFPGVLSVWLGLQSRPVY